jgi:hypothetical protein
VTIPLRQLATFAQRRARDVQRLDDQLDGRQLEAPARVRSDVA